MNKLGYFTVPQCVAIATIAAAFAVVALFNQILTDLARGLFGFYGSMVFTGVFQTPGILAYCLLRRRWAAFTTQNLFGFGQIALGNPAGFLVFWFTFAEAAAQELVLRAVPLRAARTWPVFAIAGVASFIGAQIPNYLIYGLGEMAWWTWLLPMLLVGIPSSILFPTTICLATKRALPPSSGLMLSDEMAEQV